MLKKLTSKIARKINSFSDPFKKSPIKIEFNKSNPIEFYFRPSSYADKGVIRQIFFEKDYDLTQWEQGNTLLKLAKLFSDKDISPFIIDSGANIGASAIFFNQIIKNSKIVCIEPEPGNCSLIRRNLQGTNVIVLECAVSNTTGQIRLLDFGSDWAFRTTEDLIEENGVTVSSININEVLELHVDDSVPLIAKIDIEGGESNLFSSNCEWMDVFPCIIIELHDWMLPRQGSSISFLRQIASRNYDFITRGKNVFLFNMKLIDEEIQRLSVDYLVNL